MKKPLDRLRPRASHRADPFALEIMSVEIDECINCCHIFFNLAKFNAIFEKLFHCKPPFKRCRL